ncbi:MAG: FomA family porin-like outer membrane protein [Cetobacterium sp.]|uniref:FomA family porin-like outer membrane protein n=1 Tax=Cetobacterium sp. TaxID=2071632 RepID=UPI003F347F18
MKRLAILAASILILGTVTQAAETFKPYGSVSQEAEYFGNYDTESNKDYMRFTPISGNLQISEKASADFRGRYKFGLHDGDDKTSSSDFRARWYYNHGTLENTKIDLKSMVRFEKTTKYQEGVNIDPNSLMASAIGLEYTAEYNLKFDFAKYFPSNSFITVDQFSITPSYAYMFGNGKANHAQTLGVDLYSDYTLPWGFSAELNIYSFQTWASERRAISSSGQSTDNFYTTAVEAYLYYNHTLYTTEDNATRFKFLFEGGFDPYQWSNKRVYGITRANDKVISNGAEYNYTLYAEPQLRIDHTLTETTNVYLGVKGHYTNLNTKGTSASHWRWQPRVVVGWSTKF